jgi:hypothetical protein
MTVIVCAQITDPAGVASVVLVSNLHGTQTMSLYAEDTYCANLSKKNNQTVEYYIVAVDGLGNQTIGPTHSYFQSG